MSKVTSQISLYAREVIKSEMTRQKMSPHRLAMKAGVDTANTWRFFNHTEGSFNPSFDTIAKYFQALGIKYIPVRVPDPNSLPTTGGVL